MTYIFDGRQFAKEKEFKLTQDIKQLRKTGVVPKLVSILIGDNPASVLYVNLKKKMGERVGVEVEILNFPESTSVAKLILRIKDLNKVKMVHGIMVQLPLPKAFGLEERNKIISSISKEKDVDGLRDDSKYITPTVKAVFEVLNVAYFNIVRPLLNDSPCKVVVVGSRGFEGKKIYKVLKKKGYSVSGIHRNTRDFEKKTLRADILISVTGSPGIIKAENIKKGAVVIDVGSPLGDVNRESVVGKAAFLSPVPGGVGPITITCLIENLIRAASETETKSNQL
jgi:methylenetetrahydrofolate dehydrogenase (NADP+) / methenyltetrahydrofolate cyclohydrolase